MKPIDGLERYVESVSFSNKFIRKAETAVIRESLAKAPAKLKESVGGEVSDGWWVPISHFGNYKNGNGRIYNTKLWENVINGQRDIWAGSGMLMDHPAGDSDGNPKDICGVWLDCKMGEPNSEGIGLVYGLLVPSGSLGQDLKDHLKNGLKIGTSSSGFGKLMRDGMTVDPDTYQIERLADFVLNPSQGTYFSWDESEDKIDDVIRESNETSDIDDIHTTIKETTVKDSKFTKLEEKKFRRDMESFLESANNIKDPQERLEEFKEIKSYLEEGACSDLREQVESKIAEEEAFIKQMLNERIQMKEELGIDSTRDLKEKLTKIAEDNKLAEKEAKDWKAIAEKLQEKLDEANKALEDRPTKEYLEFQKNKVSSLRETIESHDSKSAEVVKALSESLKNSNSKVAELTEKVALMESEKEELCGKIECSEKALEDSECKVKELEEKVATCTSDIEKYKEAIGKYRKLSEAQRAKFEETISKINDLKTLNEKTKANLSRVSKEAKDAQTRLRKESIKKIQEMDSHLTDTEAFYEELYKTYGNEIKPFKERIANARSLNEAKIYFYHEVLGSLAESKKIDDMRIPESMYVSPEQRAERIDDKAFYKQSMMDRMPKGWK